MVSTLPQTQNYLAGQMFGLLRGEHRQRVHGGAITSYTVEITTPITGTWSYLVDGKIVQYPATVPPDDADSIAAGLLADHQGNLEVIRIAAANIDAATPNTVAIFGRSPNDVFAVTNLVFPVGGAGSLTDTTPTKTDIPPGVAVALLNEDEIRVMGGSDTEANVFGVAGYMPANELRLFVGNNTDNDAYAPASMLDIQTKGEIPVLVEDGVTVAIGDPVHIRRVAAGSQVLGSFLIAADAGNTTPYSRARWTSPNYTDGQGNNVALLTLSAP